MPLESLSTSSLFLLYTDKHPAIYSRVHVDPYVWLGHCGFDHES